MLTITMIYRLHRARRAIVVTQHHRSNGTTAIKYHICFFFSKTVSDSVLINFILVNVVHTNFFN